MAKIIKHINIINTDVIGYETVELRCLDIIRYYSFNANEQQLWELGLKPKSIVLIDDDTDHNDYIINE